MTTEGLFTVLEETLKPSGSSPLIRLFLRNSAYFEESFVNECVEELKQIVILSGSIEPSALQKLAMFVLLDSCGIDTLEFKQL